MKSIDRDRDIYESFEFNQNQILKIPVESDPQKLKESKGAVLKKDIFDQTENKDMIDRVQAQGESIKYLDMSGNSYGLEYMEDFSIWIGYTQNISHLNLNNTMVQRKQDEIPKIILNLTCALNTNNIQFIDLSNNAISTNGAEALSYFLTQCVNLKTLILNNCGIGYMGVRCLVQPLSKGGQNLEILSLSRNRLQDDGGQQLAQLISSLPNLRELHIISNTLKDSMHSILSALVSSTAIQLIDIEDNFLDQKAVQVLCQLIEHKNLMALNINDCNLEQQFNKDIIGSFDKLGDQIRLQKLGYCYNELYDQYPEQLLKVLIKCGQNLKRVDIRGNEFEDETRELYLNGFKQNQIQRVVLGYFESDDDDDQEFQINYQRKKEDVDKHELKF